MPGKQVVHQPYTLRSGNIWQANNPSMLCSEPVNVRGKIAIDRDQDTVLGN